MYIDHCVKKYPCSELFWSAFSRIRTEYGEILCISPYSVQMPENTDQNNSEYKHFSRSGHTQRRVSSKNTRETFTKRKRKFPISTVGVCKVAQNLSSDSEIQKEGKVNVPSQCINLRTESSFYIHDLCIFPIIPPQS